MLHRVGIRDPTRIPANQNMVITTLELDTFIGDCKRRGWTFISLDDLIEAIKKRISLKKTLILTFDDGYLDNFSKAAPVLVAHEVPFAVYVSTGFIESGEIPWWYKLEAILASSRKLRVPGESVLSVRSLREKQRAFMLIRQKIMASGNEAENCKNWLNLNAVAPSIEQARLFMNWDEVRQLANLPNAIVGAHTHSHPVLSRLSDSDVFDEIRRSKVILEDHIGRQVRHFAYPFGGAAEASQREFRQVSDLCFDSAVTTKMGALNRGTIDRYSLPRCFYGPALTLNSLQNQLSYAIFAELIKRAFTSC